jgi:hypothetical protein
MKPIDQPLEVKVERYRLVISIGLDTLAFAAEHSDDWNPYDETINNFSQRWKVNNKREFGKEVAQQLQRESEDGSTPLSRLLDKMNMAVVEDGGLSIDECPAGTKSAHDQYEEKLLTPFMKEGWDV